MPSSKTAGARLWVHLWWCAALILAFALARPDALLRAAAKLSPVVEAAKSDDLTEIRKLIKERADVNAVASDGSTALLWAAYRSNAEMTKALLAAGATVDAANRYGVTPLLQASRNGNVPVMQALLDAKADPTRWHAEGETPLMAAARTGHVDAVKLLLSKGSFVNAVDPFQEQTALMWASAEGHADAVKTLLAASADPNLKAHVSTLTERRNADHPSGGFTALMFAARNGHTAVVEALMKGGADPKLTNADGLTATSIAIINDRFDLAKEMLDLGADPNDGSLYFAVDMHDQTFDTRAQDATRMQPDHPNKITALGLVKALMDLKADVNKPFTGAIHSTSMCCGPTISSTSPLQRAATAADVEVLKVLAAQGADFNKIPAEPAPAAAAGKGGPAPGGAKGNPNAGKSAAMIAMKGGKGPGIQGGPGYSRTGPPPYREPGSRDPVEALKVLLGAGANPNAKATDGNTLLHQAVQASNVKMIRALAEAGAKLDAVNNDNLTPLLMAEATGGRGGPAPAPLAPIADGKGGDGKGDAVTKGKGGAAGGSRQEVIATLRELMNLGPNDPAPQPPPVAAPAKADPGAKGKLKGKGAPPAQ